MSEAANAAAQVEPWRVLDVTAWPVDSLEMRGKRAKCWVVDDRKRRWLRKVPRRAWEPAIEATALRLARAVGLETAEGHACVWHDESGEHRGIVVRSFLESEGEQLSDGADVLRGLDPTYNPEAHEQHTLARARVALEWWERNHAGAELLLPFVHMLAFDAWVGNSDRHQGNWGLITARNVVPRLAPVYDPAACLGVELADGHPLIEPMPPLKLGRNRSKEAARRDLEREAHERIEHYIGGCRSGFGNGERPDLLLQREVTAELEARWPWWNGNVQAWVATFRTALDTCLAPYLSTIPDAWLSAARRDLALRLLAERLHVLEDGRTP